MPTIASIKDEVSTNKLGLLKAGLISLGLAVTGIKFIKWAKKEIEE